jgi:uroporphyrinogen-III synthase
MATSAAGDDMPLIGFTIGVTAERRRAELTQLIERRGARTMLAPTMRIVPLADDSALRQATEECLAHPVDYAVASTGIGWRGWLSVADSWGLGAALRSALAQATVVARGPKATGAVRADGLREAYSAPSETSDEVLDWLLARDLDGATVVLQEHGAPAHQLAAALRARNARVISVSVYAWAPPADPDAVRRLVEAAVSRELHAVTFTSAPAVIALLDAAHAAGLRADLLAAFQGDVLACCIGPVCARPLLEHGVQPLWPERGRLGALVRTLVEELPRRLGLDVSAAGRRVLIHGDAVLVDGRVHWLAPLSAAVLRALARRPGQVLSRGQLLERAWSRPGSDEHAVEAAVGRLRGALGPDADLVRTVTKRGYRLVVEPG